MSRWQRERRRQRTALVILTSVVVLALGILAFGAYREFIAPFRVPLMKINDTVITMGDYLKVLRATAVTEGEDFNPSQTPLLVFDRMQNRELIRQMAPQLHLNVTPEEVDRELRDRVLGSYSGEDVDPARLDREFNEIYRQYLTTVQLSDRDFRKMVELDLLRLQLREQLAVEVPTVAEQVHLHAILVRTRDEAEKVIARLEAGEDFATVAEEVSSDRSRSEGGDLGWVPENVYPELDEVAFALEVGEVSEPEATTMGFYVLTVSERAEAMEIDERNRERLKDRALDQWYLDQKQVHKIELFWNSKNYQWAMEQLGKDQ